MTLFSISIITKHNILKLFNTKNYETLRWFVGVDTKQNEMTKRKVTKEGH